MMHYTVSAVIPCYDAEDFLPTAIESALNQSRPPDEIIVVDDGSADGSGNIADQYPVTVIRRGVNGGAATAMNAGLRAARCDVVAWLAADDLWEPHHCDTVVGTLERCPDATVAFSGVSVFGEMSGEWMPRLPEAEAFDAFPYCFEQSVVPGITAVVHRAAMLAVGGFDEAIRAASDFDLWLRLSLRHKFLFIPALTARYRRHSRQISAHPLAQRLSVHRARCRMARSLTAGGTVRADLRHRAAGLWWEDVVKSWRQRDANALRELLEVGPETTASRAMRGAANLLPFLPAGLDLVWEASPGWIRKSCKSVVGVHSTRLSEGKPASGSSGLRWP